MPLGFAGLQRATTTAFDPVGNTLSVTNAVGAVNTFGYDADNRQVLMIEALGSGVERATTTNFDPVGNVQSSVNPRGVTTSFGYDALNRRVTELEAFGTGLQRTSTMAYDAVSNVLSQTNGLGVTASFGYDALNRRVIQIDALGTALAADDDHELRCRRQRDVDYRSAGLRDRLRLRRVEPADQRHQPRRRHRHHRITMPSTTW